MAGPTASILVRAKLGAVDVERIRAEIAERTSRVEGDDFWFEDRPFLVNFGPEYPGELEELTGAGLASVLGWSPMDAVGFAAMCNESLDHKLLGGLCVTIATLVSGVVDFGGSIRPFPCLDGDSMTAPVRVQNPDGLAGVLVGVAYRTASGAYATCHVGDVAFLKSWLIHPDFHMVK